MGPSPPGFVENIISGMQWIRGIVIQSDLRLRIANNNLSLKNVGKDVYMVTFLSSKRLDTSVTSLDWQWIVCGRKEGNTGRSNYDFCTDAPDPDNTAQRNYENPHVLDGNIVRLNGADCCDSCFVEYDWMPDCKLRQNNPNKLNMYDNTLKWVPFLHKQPPEGGATFWLYTYFTVGISEACELYNCDEAAVYRNMALHLSTPWNTTWANSIDFLPGTSITYRIPMAPHTSFGLYSNMLGFVAMNELPQRLLLSGVQDTKMPSLHLKYTTHACFPTNESSLQCSIGSTTESYDNMFNKSLTTWNEQTSIMEYEYPENEFATTVQTNYCCEVIFFSECALIIMSHSVFRKNQLQLNSEY